MATRTEIGVLVRFWLWHSCHVDRLSWGEDRPAMSWDGRRDGRAVRDDWRQTVSANDR